MTDPDKSPLALLVSRVARRRDKIVKEMQAMDADEDCFDTGGYMLLETRLAEVKRHLRELQALTRLVTRSGVR